MFWLRGSTVTERIVISRFDACALRSLKSSASSVTTMHSMAIGSDTSRTKEATCMGKCDCRRCRSIPQIRCVFPDRKTFVFGSHCESQAAKGVGYQCQASLTHLPSLDLPHTLPWGRSHPSSPLPRPPTHLFPPAHACDAAQPLSALYHIEVSTKPSLFSGRVCWHMPSIPRPHQPTDLTSVCASTLPPIHSPTHTLAHSW